MVFREYGNPVFNPSDPGTIIDNWERCYLQTRRKDYPLLQVLGGLRTDWRAGGEASVTAWATSNDDESYSHWQRPSRTFMLPRRDHKAHLLFKKLV